MKMKLTTMALGAMMAASPVMADLVFPSLSYRTGPYAAGGIPFADGYADYFTLLNIPGQEIIIENFPLKPDGFCDWAWADIHRDVVSVMFGGSYPWIREPRTAITCCTDGLRPVIFKVERIE